MIDAELEKVTHLRTLTRQLLECAKSGDWDAAVEIETTRRPLLYSVFGQVERGTHAQHRLLLNEILSADRDIMALAQQRQAELADLLRETGQGRAALKAYGSNAR